MKVCPECHATYDDQEQQCTREGAMLVAAALPKNPLLHEVLPVASTEATSMIDLEALEQARREQMRARGEDPDTPPVDTPATAEAGQAVEEVAPEAAHEEEDPEATGFIDYAALQRQRQLDEAARRAEADAVDEAPLESRGSEAAEPGAASDERSERVRPGQPIDDPEEDDDAAPARGAFAPAEDDGETEHDDYAPNHAEMSRYDYPSEYTHARDETAEGTGRPWSEEATIVGATQGTWSPAPQQSSLRGWIALGVLALGGFAAFSAYELWNTGMLTVSTLPPGALVRLDGEVLGRSPMQRRVPIGPHALNLELEGHETVMEALEVTRSGVPRVISLVPAAGGSRPMAALNEADGSHANVPTPTPTDGGAPPTPTAHEAAAPPADVLLAKAEGALAEGDLDSAFATAREMLAAHPGDRRADALLERIIEERIARSEALRTNQGTEGGRNAGRRARATGSQRAGSACADGLAQYQQGELANAKTSLQKCVQLAPRHAEAHRTLARLFEADQQIDRTRYHLERYLAVGGTDPDLRVRRWLDAHPARER